MFVSRTEGQWASSVFYAKTARLNVFRPLRTLISAAIIACVFGVTTAGAGPPYNDSTAANLNEAPDASDFNKDEHEVGFAVNSDTAERAEQVYKADSADEAEYAPAAKTATKANKARAARTATHMDSSQTSSFNHDGPYKAEKEVTGSTPTAPRPKYASKSHCDTSVVTWGGDMGTCRATVKGLSGFPGEKYRIVFDKAGTDVDGNPTSDLTGGHAYVKCTDSGHFEIVKYRKNTTLSVADEGFLLPPKTKCTYVNPSKATGEHISPASVTPPRVVKNAVEDLWATLFGSDADKTLGKSSAVTTLTQLHRMEQNGKDVTMQDFFNRLLFTNDGTRVAAMAENGHLKHLFERGKERPSSFKTGFLRHIGPDGKNAWKRYDNGTLVNDNVANATLADRVFREVDSRLDTKWPLPSGPCTLCS